MSRHAARARNRIFKLAFAGLPSHYVRAGFRRRTCPPVIGSRPWRANPPALMVSRHDPLISPDLMLLRWYLTEPFTSTKATLM